MKKAALINHCKNEIDNKKKLISLPTYFKNVDLSKAERAAIMDATTEKKEGQSTWYMIDPAKVVEILQGKAKTAAKEETPAQKAAKVDKATKALETAKGKEEAAIIKVADLEKIHKESPNAANKKKVTAAKKALTKAKGNTKKAQEALDTLTA